MQIEGKVHCFFEQSGRFEKEIHGVEVIGDTIVTQQSLF